MATPVWRYGNVVARAAVANVSLVGAVGVPGAVAVTFIVAPQAPKPVRLTPVEVPLTSRVFGVEASSSVRAPVQASAASYGYRSPSACSNWTQPALIVAVGPFRPPVVGRVSLICQTTIPQPGDRPVVADGLTVLGQEVLAGAGSTAAHPVDAAGVVEQLQRGAGGRGLRQARDCPGADDLGRRQPSLVGLQERVGVGGVVAATAAWAYVHVPEAMTLHEPTPPLSVSPVEPSVS